MSAADKQLARLVRLYGAPKTAPSQDAVERGEVFGEEVPDEHLQAFYDEYRRSLGNVDAELLDCAVCNVVDGRTIPAWPTSGEIRKAVQDITGERANEARHQESLRVTYSALAPRQQVPAEELARAAAIVEAATSKLRKDGKPGWICGPCAAAAGRSTDGHPYYRSGDTLPSGKSPVGPAWCHDRPHRIAIGGGVWWFDDWQFGSHAASGFISSISRDSWETRVASSETAQLMAMPPATRPAPEDPDGWRSTMRIEDAAHAPAEHDLLPE